MSDFSDTIKHMLNEFKSTYRRDFPKSVRTHLDLKPLGIDRKALQEIEEISLYLKAYNILTYLKAQTEQENSPLIDHNGLTSFIDNLQLTLDDYFPYGNHIVHKNRYSSEVLIRAIQIICLHKIRFNYEVLQKLKQCCKTIHELGNKMHWEKLMYAIKSYHQSEPLFFDQVIKYCQNLQQKK